MQNTKLPAIRADHRMEPIPASNTISINHPDFKNLTDWDEWVVQEYREALMTIHSAGGSFQAEVTGKTESRMIVNGVPVASTTQVWSTSAPMTGGASSPVKLNRTPVSFTELAQRISQQLQAVAETGRQITEASQDLVQGTKSLDEGLSKIKHRIEQTKF